MNRTQLPGELKAVVCQQIRRGKWTVEQAADITTFTVGSIKRWLRDLPSSSPEGPAAPPATKVAEPRPLEPGLRRILDEALERVPLLRQRSLVNYVRRHYGCKVPRRAAAAYLREFGLVERTTVAVEQPMRRFGLLIAELLLAQRKQTTVSAHSSERIRPCGKQRPARQLALSRQVIVAPSWVKGNGDRASFFLLRLGEPGPVSLSTGSCAFDGSKFEQVRGCFANNKLSLIATRLSLSLAKQPLITLDLLESATL